MEEINCVLTGDNRYADQLLVTMTSIMTNINNRLVHFYLIMKGIDQELNDYLKTISNQFHCNVTIIDGEAYEHYFNQVDVRKFKNSYINIVCYYRLLMLNVLPDTVKKAFYIDGDMIINGDIAWIYDQMCESDIISAVVEVHAMDNRENILSHVYKWDEFTPFTKNPMKYPYFNAGFFLLNVDLAKEKGLWDDALSFLKKHPNPPYADQDILNAIIGQKRPGNVVFLPPHYNVFCDMEIDYDRCYNNSYYPPEEIRNSFKFGVVLHYAGGRKPWDYNNCHYYNEWWSYASKSPAAGNLLLKSQIVHSEMAKELYYIKNEYYQILPKVNQKNRIMKSVWLKNKLKEYYNKIDPLILWRYSKKSQTSDLGIVSSALLLSKYKSEALRGINSDHNIKFDKIRNKIDKADVVSFDIFDTLVCRPFASPQDVFRYIEIKYDIPDFYNKRISAETKCRKERYGQEDVSLDQIYEYLDQYKEMKDVEIEVELNISFRNNGVLSNLYDYAISCGKKVILISDMYLSRTTVESILHKCGIYGYEKLYLSSDEFKTKQHGSLFKQVLKEYGDVKYLHIGDNLHSDYNIPKSMGMDAYAISKNIDALLESDRRMSLFFESDHSLGASLILGLLASFRYEFFDYWVKFGIMYAGPIICGYVNWLEKTVDSDEELFFVARDGYTLQKAFELLSNSKINTHYYYSPRHISNLCNLDIERKLATDIKEAGPAALSIIRQYEELTGTKTGINDVSKAIAFIRTHSDEIVDLANKTREKYSKYVSGITDSKKIALVDTITIHFSSQKLLKESLSNRDVKGYYWTVIKTESNDDLIRNYSYDTYQKKYGFEVKDWDVMEFFITSPEPPILDVAIDGQPIYKEPSTNDIIRSEVYPRLSKGELLFVKRYSEYSPRDIHISAETLNCFMNILCDSPTKVDRKHFKKIKHAYDSENSIYVPIFKQWYEKR